MKYSTGGAKEREGEETGGEEEQKKRILHRWIGKEIYRRHISDQERDR